MRSGVISIGTISFCRYSFRAFSARLISDTSLLAFAISRCITYCFRSATDMNVSSSSICFVPDGTSRVILLSCRLRLLPCHFAKQTRACLANANIGHRPSIPVSNNELKSMRGDKLQTKNIGCKINFLFFCAPRVR